MTTRFACDLAACKGACCTFPGGSGPPISENEIPLIRKAWKLVRDLVPEEHRVEGERHGLVVDDGEDLTIRCYDDRACVFVMYEGDVAICSIQKLYHEGRFHWPKPLSCHLFPLRVRGKNRDQLHFERFSECTPAIEAGERDGVTMVEFLEVPLRRGFGDDFYQELKQRSDDVCGSASDRKETRR